MNINGINGFNNFNIGGGMVNPNNQEPEQAAVPAPEPVEERPVNPDLVMKFMGNNAIVPPVNVTPVQMPPEDVERIAGFVHNFEQFFNAASEEFGENIAYALANVELAK